MLVVGCEECLFCSDADVKTWGHFGVSVGFPDCFCAFFAAESTPVVFCNDE